MKRAHRATECDKIARFCTFAVKHSISRKRPESPVTGLRAGVSGFFQKEQNGQRRRRIRLLIKGKRKRVSFARARRGPPGQNRTQYSSARPNGASFKEHTLRWRRISYLATASVDKIAVVKYYNLMPENPPFVHTCLRQAKQYASSRRAWGGNNREALINCPATAPQTNSMRLSRPT